MTTQQEARVAELASEFADRAAAILAKAEGDYAPNPFLAACLDLRGKDVSRFFLTQRAQRGIVTSFGSVLESVAKALDQKARIADVDLVFDKDGVRYYVQFKSGPEGFTGPALDKTAVTFRKLKEDDPRCRTVLAFGYGTKATLSPIWGSGTTQKADLVLVGKEFWDFFGGVGTYERILRVFKDAGRARKLQLFDRLDSMIVKDAGRRARYSADD